MTFKEREREGLITRADIRRLYILPGIECILLFSFIFDAGQWERERKVGYICDTSISAKRIRINGLLMEQTKNVYWVNNYGDSRHWSMRVPNSGFVHGTLDSWIIYHVRIQWKYKHCIVRGIYHWNLCIYAADACIHKIKLL